MPRATPTNPVGNSPSAGNGQKKSATAPAKPETAPSAAAISPKYGVAAGLHPSSPAPRHVPPCPPGTDAVERMPAGPRSDGGRPREADDRGRARSATADGILGGRESSRSCRARRQAGRSQGLHSRQVGHHALEYALKHPHEHVEGGRGEHHAPAHVDGPAPEPTHYPGTCGRGKPRGHQPAYEQYRAHAEEPRQPWPEDTHYACVIVIRPAIL